MKIFCLSIFFLILFESLSSCSTKTKTISDAILEGSCTTSVAKGLSLQLVKVLLKEFPNLLAEIQTSSKLLISNTVEVVPILQKTAYDHLLLALEESSDSIQINLAFRLLHEQFLLYKWYLEGLCGITLAYAPGNSSHESGLAIDISDNSKWINILKNYGFNWFGEADEVHFTYDGPNSQTINKQNTLAFQKLWNCNNPDNKIEENGVYSKKTEDSLLKSPVDGFPESCISLVEVF